MAAGSYLAPRHVKTARLELRPIVPADHPPFAAMSADAEVMRYIGDGSVFTPEISWRSMAGLLGHWEMLGYGMWAVDLPGTGFIGRVGYIDVLGWPGFELGWMLAREHWGRGYAKEAAQVALEIAFATLKKERVISLIRAGNAASIRVAEKLEAVREGEVEMMGSAAEVYVHRRRG